MIVRKASVGGGRGTSLWRGRRRPRACPAPRRDAWPPARPPARLSQRNWRRAARSTPAPRRRSRRRSAASGLAPRARRGPARSGRPPRDTTAATFAPGSAAAHSAAAAPVLAPKIADRKLAEVGLAGAATRDVHEPTSASSSMSNTLARSASSAGVSRSNSSVASPDPLSTDGDVAVAGAVPAAAAAVREDHDARGVGRHREMPAEHGTADVDAHLLVTGSRTMRGGTGPVQTCGDLTVGGLREVAIELADAGEVGRCVQGDELVGLAGKSQRPIGRSDRNRQHHTRGSLRSRHLTRRSGRRAGRHTVVDDHHGAAVEPNCGRAPAGTAHCAAATPRAHGPRRLQLPGRRRRPSARCRC